MKTYTFAKRALIMVSLATIASVGVAACAGPNRVQTVSIKTTPSANVQCVLKNDAGNYDLGKTPGRVKVKRSLSDLEISCLGNGFAGDGVITPKRRGAPFGNVALSRAVNGEASRITGTSYKYPSKVLLTVTQTSLEMANMPPSLVVPSAGSAALPQAGYIEKAGNSAVLSPEQKPLEKPVQKTTQNPMTKPAAGSVLPENIGMKAVTLPPAVTAVQQTAAPSQAQPAFASARPMAAPATTRQISPAQQNSVEQRQAKEKPTSIFYTTDLSPSGGNNPITVRVFEESVIAE